MNASGRPNTCKPRGSRVAISLTTGARVSNAYVTYLGQGDSFGKPELIPHDTIMPHGIIVKTEVV